MKILNFKNISLIAISIGILGFIYGMIVSSIPIMFSSLFMSIMFGGIIFLISENKEFKNKEKIKDEDLDEKFSEYE